ncbi:MAG: hypothetical protein KC413_11195 [Anaerolineales bacterium]|nr:hypothetical protein [Anaerolineales bacterium]
MNRLEWVLGIMLALLLVIVAALALMFWFRADEPGVVAVPANTATEVASYANKVEPAPAAEGQSAKLAFVAAQRTAVAWQPDAELLNATATWPQGATEKALRQGEAAWGFNFYSPATASMALISVVDNEAGLIMQGAMETPTQLFDTNGWNLDSSDAVDRLMQEGGSAFINVEGVTALTMTLTTDAGNGRILWHIQLAATQTLRTMTLSLDATSGEILAINQTT